MRDDVDRLGQTHDRIPDELPRAVPGDLASAIDVDHGRAVGRPFMRLGALARGVDGLVLEQHAACRGARPRRRRRGRCRCSAHPSRYGTILGCEAGRQDVEHRRCPLARWHLWIASNNTPCDGPYAGGMTADSRTGRPRASSRETLAEAACELFLEQGYEATSIADDRHARGSEPLELLQLLRLEGRHSVGGVRRADRCRSSRPCHERGRGCRGRRPRRDGGDRAPTSPRTASRWRS